MSILTPCTDRDCVLLTGRASGLATNGGCAHLTLSLGETRRVLMHLARARREEADVIASLRRQHEKIAWRVCDALGVPRYTSIVEIERTVAALRASNARLLEALAILGVEYVSDDEAIGAYWLPVPEGRFVASDAVEAATARRARIVFDGEAEETRATLLAAVERHRKSREACDELTRMWEDEYAPGGGVGGRGPRGG